MYSYRLYNLISLCVALILLGGCSEIGNQSETINNSQALTNQPHSERAQHPGNLSFQTVDVERFWNWVETDELSSQTVETASNADQIDYQIELLEEATRQQNMAASLPEMERLEYSFLAHTKLSVLHSRKAGLFKEDEEERHNHIEHSLAHQQEALSHLDQLIERDSAYQVDRAFPELELTSAKCHLDPDRDCLGRLLSIIETYSDSDLPYGPYPEWFVSSPVLSAVSYYINQSSDNTLKQEMFNELRYISHRNDVIGVSASLVMAKHFLTEGQLGTVRSILENPSVEIEDLPREVQIQWRNVEQAYQHFLERHSE